MIASKMDKKTAEEIVGLMLDIGAKINQSIALVEESFTEEDFLEYRKNAGKFMGIILLDVMNPIFKEFPDLEPNGLR